jgi:hypothetical protein
MATEMISTGMKYQTGLVSEQLVDLQVVHVLALTLV